MDYSVDESVRALLISAKQGDDAAFEQLVTMYRPMMELASRRHSIDVQEGFSEALLGFYRAVVSYDVDRKDVTFGLYARICIDRCFIDFLRKKGRDVSSHVDSNIDVDSIAVSGGVQAMLEHREQMAHFLAVAREVLSDFEYSVYRLWMLGYKTADISASLSSSAKSVDNAKNRMLTKLRSRLSGEI